MSAGTDMLGRDRRWEDGPYIQQIGDYTEERAVNAWRKAWRFSDGSRFHAQSRMRCGAAD